MGSFIISIYKRKETNNWQINPSFQLWLESKDLSTLEELKDFFGVGILNTRKNKDATSYTVTKIDDLMNVVIPHFTNFPLQTQKKVDFDLWVKIVELISKKEHLTPEGVLKIFSLKSVLNKGLSKNISNIDKIEILERPLHLVDLDEFKNIDPHWISGFVAGDGTFDIKITQRGSRFQVELRFRITQHIRDAHLLGVIAGYFGCGKVYVRSNGTACDLFINTIPDNINKVIPFFNQYPIRTVKEKNFKECIWKPNIVAPITIVKLIENVNIKWDVGAKLYGIIPTKLFISIYINKDSIKGKNICPLLLFIWFITILYTVKYIDSIDNDQLFGVTML